MDLINADNIEPREIDINVMEEQLFNAPDPYDLAEVDSDRIDEELKATIIRSSNRFNIAQYVKLNDVKLMDLIKHVDEVGPGAKSARGAPLETQTVVGKPGEWSVDSFI